MKNWVSKMGKDNPKIWKLISILAVALLCLGAFNGLQVFRDGLTTDTINETTTDAGVTVETILMKDKSIGATGDRVTKGWFTDLEVTNAIAGSITGVIDSDQVEMPEIGTATYDDVQDWSNGTQSAGIISGGAITDGGSGTVDVTAVKGIIKTTDSQIGSNVYFDLTGLTGQTLTDNSINYIAVDYNSGTPQWVVGVTDTANGHTIFNVGKVYREGTGVDIIDSGLNIYDFTKRVQQHHTESANLHFVSGAVVSEPANLKIAITAGVMYAGINRITTSAIDTNVADTFEYYYNDGSWQESDETDIDNLQYNDFGVGLATLSNNRYGVHWVYKGTGSTTFVIYGTDNYTLVEAQSAQPPSSLPPHVEGFGVLRARIIISKSSASITEIDSVDDTPFTASTASNHNELGGLQGGTASEYYHLDSTDYTALTTSTQGDLWYSSATDTIAKLGKGTAGQVLTMNAGATAPEWADDGGGDVVGPASATDNAVVRYDTTTGKLIQDSGMVVDDSGNTTTGADTNITFTFGKGKIGSIIADEFAFGHYDNFTSTDYGVKQDANGKTTINSKTGQPIYFSINDTAKMTLDSSGNVGIGTASPSSLNANADNLVVGGGSGSTGVTIYSGSSSTGSIYFADETTTGYSGWMVYNHSTNAFSFGTNGSGTARMVIDASGNIFFSSLGTLTGKADVQYDTTTNELGYVSSSSRYKENIKDATDSDTNWIWALTPRKYDRKDGSNKGELGLIAEEVENINSKIVCKRKIKDPKNDKKEIEVVETYSRSELIIPMLKQMQILKAIITAQAQAINHMDERIKELENKANDFTIRLQALEQREK